MATDSAFWRSLRRDFESLQPGQFTLTWSSDLPTSFKGESLPSQWTWWRFPDESLRARLRAFALRGARGLGYESEDAWFDRLREADFVKFKLAGHSLEKQPDGSMLELRDGSIDDVVKQSITLCHVLEADCVESLPKDSSRGRCAAEGGFPKQGPSRPDSPTAACDASARAADCRLPQPETAGATAPKTDQSIETEPSGDEPSSTDPGPAMNHANNRTDRRKAVDAYIEEVFSRTGERITRTDIWKSLRYKSRAEFERWESRWYEKVGKKPNATANRRFTNFLTEKPHLK